MDDVLKPTAERLVKVGYDILREGSLESRFAISNGFLGIRGARAITVERVGSCRRTPMSPGCSTRSALNPRSQNSSQPPTG